jgi:hypothetical protein
MFQNKRHKTSVSRIHLITYAGLWVTRENLGLPEDWRKIERWIEDSRDIVKSCPNLYIPPTRKNLEIPVLKSYDQKATEEFWSIFPKNFNQTVLKTVNIKALKKLIQKCWFSWTLPQRMTAKKALRQLQGFAPVKLTKCENKKCKFSDNERVFYDRRNMFLGEKRIRGGAF